MKNGRWFLAGGLFVALILDFVIVQSAMRHSQGPLFAKGALVGIVLSIAVALALATRTTRGSVLVAAMLLFGWLGAFAAGSLYATCDLNMRPFIWQLIAWLGPVGLVGTGAILAVPFLLWGAGSLAYKFFGRPSTVLATLLIAVSVPTVGLGTYLAESASGAHPVEGNCVV